MEVANGESSGVLSLLTAQQMMERCIVPVKAEFLVRKAPPKPAKEEARAATADATAEPTAAACGTTNGQKQHREQEQTRNQSRKQMRKDVRAGRPAALCTNYALGRCTWGDRCKFSHDLSEYVKTKPVDLPGICPWTAVRATCPYGITCRYARTHGVDDELHRTLETVLLAPGMGATEAAAVDGKPAPVADGGDATAAAAAASADVGGAAAPPCALPLPAAIEQETNCLGKEVQTLLWKNRYDFSRADAILKSMDLRISFKHQPKPIPTSDGGGGGGRGGSGGKKGSGKAGRGKEAGGTQPSPQAPPDDLPSPSPEQQQQPAEVEAGAEGEQRIGEGLAARAAGPARVAAEAEGMQVDAGAAGSAPPPGAAAAAGTDACTTASADVDAAPAAKRQRTDVGDGVAAAKGASASPASDAAAVAALVAEQEPESAATTGNPPGRSAASVSEAREAHVEVPLRPCERRRVDFRGKTYLAPLTTVGNLPFRRVCKSLGVDVTCGEMALATCLLQGQASEWALMKRHPSEDFFGVQVCGGYPDALARVGQLLGEQLTVDFVDINMGCPIDLVCDKNAGSALLRQPRRIEQILRATSAALGETPLTFKTRKGFNDGEDVAHTFLHKAGEWGAAAVTLHGRTRQQRYSKLADWEYVQRCGAACSEAGLQLIGNGDVFSYLDWNQQMAGAGGQLAALMIGRGALIKPWIFTEIKEQRHWDISASERLDLYKQFCAAGLEHWGSDGRGVETTRRFLLEWLSFTCRYVPVGLLEVVPQQMNHRPPAFRGRNELETLLSSEDPQDWVRVSEMLLGPPPAPLNFTAKHKSNSYAAPGTGSELDMARG